MIEPSRFSGEPKGVTLVDWQSFRFGMGMVLLIMSALVAHKKEVPTSSLIIWIVTGSALVLY